MKRNFDLYTMWLCGSSIALKSDDGDEVIIDIPYIRTTGMTSKCIIKIILNNCSEILHTVPLNVTRKELNSLDYLLTISNIPTCEPDVVTMAPKIRDAINGFNTEV